MILFLMTSGYFLELYNKTNCLNGFTHDEFYKLN